MHFVDKEALATHLEALQPEYRSYTGSLWEDVGIRSSEMLGYAEASALYYAQASSCSEVPCSCNGYHRTIQPGLAMKIPTKV